MTRRERWDAIVVGSGITGGWAAKELSERGLRTLVLEAGRPIDPGTDYVEHVQAWQVPHRGYGDREAFARDQPVQRRCYACDEWGSKFFVNDREHPYSTPEDQPFLWIRGRQVGGRSIMWGRQVYRWSDLDFEANARDGHGTDWPIRYADLAPWYDHVERFIGVSGMPEGLAQLPDSVFLPPMDLTCAESAVRERLLAHYGTARTLTIGRTAILTRNHNGRSACHYCGPCERGCITHSYFSSLAATLPAAARTGRAELRPHSVVHSVMHDEATGRATGVRVIDGQSGEDLEFEARLVFLCASALESARILLNSAPGGLGNGSGTLGRYLMDHTMGGGASATLPGFEDRHTTGRRPNGIYLARFRNVTDQHPGFLRGYAYQGGGSREGWGRGNAMRGVGAAFKHELRSPGRWRMRLYGFGECLPRAENRVTLDPAVVDRWGIPVLRIECAWGENERVMLQDMATQAAEMLDAAGCTDVEPFVQDNPPGLTIHEMGTARMGRDPRTSMLNGWNQAHEVPNLFVTDGACMASSACQNPSLTYMAITARAANHAADLLDRREL